jgi:hypothetical protein
MSNGGLDLIKQDLAFYLEKTFQFSFVYVAAVFAVLAGAKVSAFQNFACSAMVPAIQLVLAAILLLNLLYLTLAISCAHAILKRAYFILDRKNCVGEGDIILRGWEAFTRKRADGYILPAFFWNMDNYFSAFLYLIVFACSMLLCRNLIDHGKGWIRSYGWSQLAVHAILLVITAVSIRSLLRMCAKRANQEEMEGSQKTGDPSGRQQGRSEA